MYTAFAVLVSALGGELAEVPVGTSAVPAPAPGVQGPEAVAELLASVCTCFLPTQSGGKWL